MIRGRVATRPLPLLRDFYGMRWFSLWTGRRASGHHYVEPADYHGHRAYQRDHSPGRRVSALGRNPGDL